MKTKSIILMAVLSVFLLVAGNAFANQVDLTYSVTGSTGDYDIQFKLDNTTTDFRIYAFNIDYTDVLGQGVPNGWTFAAYPDYLAWGIKPADATLGVDVTDISINVASLPDIINYTIYTKNGTWEQFVGSIDFDGSKSPNPVPEPATMLLLGSGLCGMAGLRKRFIK
jgi:hypothetical protein